MVELTTLVGYYATLALQLRVFRVGAPSLRPFDSQAVWGMRDLVLRRRSQPLDLLLRRVPRTVSTGQSARPWRFRWHPRPARPRSSAGTGSRSPAPTRRTPRRPTRTCSPRPSTGWSPASVCRASSWARSSPAPSSSTRRDFNLTRESVLGSKLVGRPRPAYDVQQACGTGLEAAVLVANKIALGQIESGIAGGVDTTSDAPLAVGDDLRRVLIEPEQRQDAAGPAQGAGEDPPRPARAGDPAQRRAAHRPGDGRPRGDHRQGVGDRPRGAGRADRPLAPATWRPPTTAASSTTWSRRTSA